MVFFSQAKPTHVFQAVELFSHFIRGFGKGWMMGGMGGMEVETRCKPMEFLSELNLRKPKSVKLSCPKTFRLKKTCFFGRV